MNNTTMVSLHIDELPECIPLNESPHVCLKLSPFSRIYIKINQVNALCALLQSAGLGPVEERIDEIRGAT